MGSTELALQTARQIFRHGVEAVIPSNLIRNQVKLSGSLLKVQNVSIDLKQYDKSYVVGFGKAVLPMAEELLSIVTPEKIDRCILSIPEGSRASPNSKIEIYRGAKNNVPDASAFEASQKIVNVVKQCSAEDLLIVLISGGGSALLPYPRPPITLEEKATLFKQLSTGGATINELNSVRKAISLVKGGGLVKLCRAKRILSLILSDVLGDKLDVIASGPTVKNMDDESAASQVVSKYIPAGRVAPNIAKVLSERSTYPPEIFNKVDNIIVGNNTIALEACSLYAAKQNSIPVILTFNLEGDARIVGSTIANLCQTISNAMNLRNHEIPVEEIKRLLTSLQVGGGSAELLLQSLNTAKANRQNICLLFGGETTVNVKGTGRGGRNQELALSAAQVLHENKRSQPGTGGGAGNITILCAGTDGIDGPCEAAGAVINYSTLSEADADGLDTLAYLNNNDSFSYFAKLAEGKFHVVTGHTGTNVMDLVIALIEQRKDMSSL